MGFKKEGVFFVVLFIFLFIQRVEGIGVSPAGYKIDFQPGFKGVFNFNFYGGSPDVKYNVLVLGDLAEYVELSGEYFYGNGNINALLKLPKNIEKPGVHRIRIALDPQPGNNSASTLTVLASVIGVIDVRVAYPGKYAEMEFESENANAGQEVNFKLKIYSRGNENIIAKSYIEIYDSMNKSAATLPIGENEILSAQSIELTKMWDTKDIAPGKYGARAFVEYEGEKISSWTNFRLGELFVDVVDYKKEFERGKINPITLDIESYWNDYIENVYGEITILDHETDISPFSTPSVDLGGFERKTITAHFDTKDIEENKFKAKVVLHYSGKTTEKVINLKFKREVNYYIIGGLAGGVILLIVIIVLVLWILKLKRNAKEGKFKLKTEKKDEKNR